jgi:hypothetical protein
MGDPEQGSERTGTKSNALHIEKPEFTAMLDYPVESDVQKEDSGDIIELQDSARAISLRHGGQNPFPPASIPTPLQVQRARHSSSTSRGSYMSSSQHSNQSEVIHSMTQSDLAGGDVSKRAWAENRTWTLVHSFYANMGGLLYTLSPYGHEPIIHPLTTNDIVYNSDHLYSCPLQDLILEKKDIEDKSKADWLLKAIAISQIIWLILNVAARGITKLPITQLEIATVAFSFVAIVTYVANWWKPKDIVTVTVLRRPASLAFAEKFSQSFRCFVDGLLAPSKSTKSSYHRRYRIKNSIIWMEGDIPLIWVLMALSSMVFGGLHCLAWKFDFPSNAELMMWRAASIASALLPSVALGVSLFLRLLLIRAEKTVFTPSLFAILAPLEQFPPDWWDILKAKPKFLE